MIVARGERSTGGEVEEIEVEEEKEVRMGALGHNEVATVFPHSIMDIIMAKRITSGWIIKLGSQMLVRISHLLKGVLFYYFASSVFGYAV